MKREHRKQIKRDELVTGMERAAIWVRAHRDEVRATLIGVAIVVVGRAGVHDLPGPPRGVRREGVRRRLRHLPCSGGRGAAAGGGQAGRAPVRDPGREVPEGGGRLRRGGAALRLAARGPARAVLRRPVPDRAGGLRRGGEGPGQSWWRTRDRSSLESGLARLALADLHRRRGETDKAVAAYRQMVDDADAGRPARPRPDEPGLHPRGGARAKEARASYRRLTEEFPAQRLRLRGAAPRPTTCRPRADRHRRHEEAHGVDPGRRRGRGGDRRRRRGRARPGPARGGKGASWTRRQLPLPQPQGEIPEQPPGRAAAASSSGGRRRCATLVESLDRAAADPKVTAVVLRVSFLPDVGLGQGPGAAGRHRPLPQVRQARLRAPRVLRQQGVLPRHRLHEDLRRAHRHPGRHRARTAR